MDAKQMLGIADSVVDKAWEMFVDGFGAEPAHMKSARDFATKIDLEIEHYLRAELVHLTGIPVLGEETGGEVAKQCWIIDPIDGTANYAASNPMCSILVSLVVEGQPVVGITAMPMLGKRLSAYEGSPLFVNGKPVPKVETRSSVVSHVGFSSLVPPLNSDFPREIRQELLAKLAESYLRPRITGSVGVDLAFTAEGIFEGCISFSPHIWDNVAGVMLVRAAGGIVSDPSGNPWRPGSALIAGNERAQKVLLGTIASIRF